MKKLIWFLVIAFLCFGFMVKDTENKMQEFKWLEGSWVMKKKNGGSIMESWQTYNDTTMLGESLNFSVTGQSSVLENLKLTYSGGTYYYRSRVTGQNNNEELAFTITAHSEKKFVAEKPDHDFPKRITYELISKDSIHAYIDGGPAMADKRSDFYYSRYRN